MSLVLRIFWTCFASILAKRILCCPEEEFLEELVEWEDLLLPGEDLPYALFDGKAWYAQLVMPSALYREEENFCVREVWTLSSNFGLRDRVVASVTRSYNDGGVEGERVTSSMKIFELNGLREDELEDGQPHMRTGIEGWPGILPVDVFIADASVVDTSGGDQWIVLVGNPDQKSRRGCHPNSGLTGGGYVVFTRDPLPSSRLLRYITKRLDNLGLDTSVLKAVPHDGCVYPG